MRFRSIRRRGWYVEQYLSLHQDSATNTPNDLLSLAAESLAVTVTVTDGDGDKASPRPTCRPRSASDDGPSADGDGTRCGGVDETPALDEGNTDTGSPPISTPATMLPGRSSRATIRMFRRFATLRAAVSTGALVTPTIAFGADGPFGGGRPGTSYALSVTNPVSGLIVTDGAAITLSLVTASVVGVGAGGTA